MLGFHDRSWVVVMLFVGVEMDVTTEVQVLLNGIANKVHPAGRQTLAKSAATEQVESPSATCRSPVVTL